MRRVGLVWIGVSVVFDSNAGLAQPDRTFTYSSLQPRKMHAEIIGESVKELDHHYSMCPYEKLISGKLGLRDKEEIWFSDNHIVVREGPLDKDIAILPNNITPDMLKNRAGYFELQGNYATADIYFKLAIQIELNQPSFRSAFRYELLSEYVNFIERRKKKENPNFNFEKLLKKGKHDLDKKENEHPSLPESKEE